MDLQQANVQRQLQQNKQEEINQTKFANGVTREKLMADMAKLENSKLSDRDYVMAIIGHYDIVEGYPKEFPVTVPHMPTEAEMAGMDKDEKKALRAKYDSDMVKYTTRKQLYEDITSQISEKIEEVKEQDERNQYVAELKDFILQDPELAAKIKDVSKIPDQKEKIKACKEILRKSAERILESEKYGEEYAGGFEQSVDFTQATDALRMLYAEQAGPEYEKECDVVYAKLDEIEEQFVKQGKENIISKIVNFELPDVFADLFKDEAAMEMAQNALIDDYSELANKNQRDVDAYDREICNTLGVTEIKGLKGNYIKKKRIKEYRDFYNEFKADNPALSDAEVKRVVVDAMRQRLQAECSFINVHETVESDALTMEKYKQTGGASYHNVHPAAEALRIVKQSKGMLCAVPYNKQKTLMELRPSLPEKVKIKGEEVEFRKLYKTFLKGIMTHFFDEKGQLKKNKNELLKQANLIDYEILGQYDLAEPVGKEARAALRKVMGSEANADTWIRILRNSPSHMFTEVSITDTIQNFIRIEKYTDKNSKEFKKMKKKLKELKLKDYKTNGNIPISDSDINKALEECRADAQKAKIALLKIRNMDVDSQEVPIINACSANGRFVRAVNVDLLGENNEAKMYHTLNDFVDIKHKTALSKLLDNFNRLFSSKMDSEESFKKKKGRSVAEVYEMLTKYYNLLEEKGKEKFSEEDILSEEEKKIVENGTLWLKNCAQMFAKYEYHVAGSVAEVDGNLYTTEGFAAETSQFMVEPFTMHAAVGEYKGGKDAFIDYYRLDDPFDLSVVNMLKCQIKFMDQQAS